MRPSSLRSDVTAQRMVILIFTLLFCSFTEPILGQTHLAHL